jgi:hypothetical protein
VISTMRWLLLLPFRLAFGIIAGLVVLPFVLILLPFALLLWLPFDLMRVALRVVVGLVVLPIVVVPLVLGLIVAGIGIALAIAVPLLPIALVAFCIWALVRLTGGPVHSSPLISASSREL